MSRDSGLTLVEILVAMVLVLIVLAGSLAFVARGRDAQRRGEALARLDEALDAGFTVLVDEIRLAGYLGLAPPTASVDGASSLGSPEAPALVVAGACGRSLAHDLAFPIAAADAAYQSAPGVALGCRASPSGRPMPAADTLVVRHASADPARPEAGRLQLETNLRSAVLAADGVGRLGTDARWHDLEVGVYYVSADSTGRPGWPSLRRKRLVGGTRPAFQDEELVSGIADLQIALGVDDPSDSDAAVDRWVRPGEPGPGQVRALRLELEAVSDVDAASLPVESRRRRGSRIVELRNRGFLP